MKLTELHCKLFLACQRYTRVRKLYFERFSDYSYGHIVRNLKMLFDMGFLVRKKDGKEFKYRSKDKYMDKVIGRLQDYKENNTSTTTTKKKVTLLNF